MQLPKQNRREKLGHIDDKFALLKTRWSRALRYISIFNIEIDEKPVNSDMDLVFLMLHPCRIFLIMYYIASTYQHIYVHNLYDLAFCDTMISISGYIIDNRYRNACSCDR
jgi:hypothetical protein